MRTARCQCGALSATTACEPGSVVVCSCAECQRRSGSVFGANAYFKRDDIVRSLSEMHLPDTDLSKIQRPKIEMPDAVTKFEWPRVDLSSIDVPKALAGAAEEPLQVQRVLEVREDAPRRAVRRVPPDARDLALHVVGRQGRDPTGGRGSVSRGRQRLAIDLAVGGDRQRGEHDD